MVKIYTKTDSWCQKAHEEFGKLQKSNAKSKKLKLGGFCLKNTFLQLQHIQRIYLTFISTACLKIHQTPYVTFEAISHFS